MRKKSKFKKIINDKLTLEKPEETPSDLTTPITNETVAEHREEVLSSARKYIYPLQHSKHRIVLISTALFIAAIVIFFSYCTVSLYKTKSVNGFLYGVTRVIPFPIAKAGSNWVSYENYLFNLRRYMHYYQTQQRLDFKTESGKQQLAEYKKRALQKVVDDAYVKQLAKQNKITVSNQELDEQINIVREQNRLGASEKGFEDVLKENFGWTVNDFKRSLKQQMLSEKVAGTLDTQAQAKAKAALTELKGGANFADVAKKYSEDLATKDNGGEYGLAIDKTNRDISAQTVNALFKLQPGQYSEVINNGFGLEIVKNIELQGNKIRGAHILFNFKDISGHINDYKDKHKARLYIKL